MVAPSEVKVSFDEWNTSALDRIVLLSFPPAINTSPLVVGAAMAPARAPCSSVFPDAGSAVNVPANGL
jgi:hypothetical protein